MSARLQAQAQASRIDQKKAQFYPNVNLSAFIGVHALGLNLLTSGGSGVGAIGPAISLPIFSGGRLQRALGARLGKAQEAVDAATEAQRQARSRYDGGLASYLEVLAAEDALLGSLDTLTNLRSASFSLDIALQRALGGGYQTIAAR